jgi:hypothetical protein
MSPITFPLLLGIVNIINKPPNHHHSFETKVKYKSVPFVLFLHRNQKHGSVIISTSSSAQPKTKSIWIKYVQFPSYQSHPSSCKKQEEEKKTKKRTTKLCVSGMNVTLGLLRGS